MAHTKAELVMAGYTTTLDDLCELQQRIIMIQQQVDGLAASLQEHIDSTDNWNERITEMAEMIRVCGIRAPIEVVS